VVDIACSLAGRGEARPDDEIELDPELIAPDT